VDFFPGDSSAEISEEDQDESDFNTDSSCLSDKEGNASKVYYNSELLVMATTQGSVNAD